MWKSLTESDALLLKIVTQHSDSFVVAVQLEYTDALDIFLGLAVCLIHRETMN